MVEKVLFEQVVLMTKKAVQLRKDTVQRDDLL